MLTYIRSLLANRQGTFLIEALVGAVVLAIGAVAMLAAFGRSSDLSGASVEYIMANQLAQKQLAILAVQNQAFWTAILPINQPIPPDIPDTPVVPTNAYYALCAVAVQGDTSPVTLKGSNSQFTITNQAYWSYDSINPTTNLRRGSGNIDVVCTVSWTSSGKTGTTKSRNTSLILKVKY
ncbi:MAG: hypothetical protein WCP79_12020 [Bacillota bacterium]